MTPTVDLVLGRRYQLRQRIARGGMGEVWRANDLALGRDVAVKVLRPDIGDDPLFLERFRSEARNTALLAHPGIAQVFDYGEDGQYAYLVMELVPGDPLSAILIQEGAISIDRTLDLMGQCAHALQAAHDKGVVHRDIKPGNILVMPTGQVKLTDFGIARGLDSQTLTQTGRVMGTPHYFSPEQSAGERATAFSDIYALGVVAYECLSGRRPFDSETPVALALAHLREEPPPLPETIPAGVRALIGRAMAKDPAQRPASAAHLGRRLLSLRDTYRVAPPPAAQPDPAAAEKAPSEAPTGPRGGYPSSQQTAGRFAAPSQVPSAGGAGGGTTYRVRPRRRGPRLVLWLLLLVVIATVLVVGSEVLGLATATGSGQPDRHHRVGTAMESAGTGSGEYRVSGRLSAQPAGGLDRPIHDQGGPRVRQQHQATAWEREGQEK